MDAIEEQFAADFATWDLTLPPDATAARTPGCVEGSGWRIRYVFGSDDGGDYLDYLASHRMTNARHVRLRATGEAESLPCYHEMFVWDGTPEAKARAEAEYRAHNGRIGEMLKRKGLAD